MGAQLSYVRGHDPTTLREIVDTEACRARLEEIATQRSLPVLLERVWLLKVLGRAGDALAVAEEAVRVSRIAGTRKDLLRARVLHATILQHQGSHELANQELAACASEAEAKGWASLAAFAYQHQGSNHYDAGAFDEARESFKKALFLRYESGADQRRIESVLRAIEAAERRRNEAAVGTRA